MILFPHCWSMASSTNKGPGVGDHIKLLSSAVFTFVLSVWLCLSVCSFLCLCFSVFVFGYPWKVNQQCSVREYHAMFVCIAMFVIVDVTTPSIHAMPFAWCNWCVKILHLAALCLNNIPNGHTACMSCNDFFLVCWQFSKANVMWGLPVAMMCMSCASRVPTMCCMYK